MNAAVFPESVQRFRRRLSLLERECYVNWSCKLIVGGELDL